MSEFIDREQEMDTLEREYQRDGSSLVILYGRRRVGKTSLITNFIRNKKALFYLANEESENQNRIEFKNKAAEFIGNELLREASISNWETIFRTVMETGFESKPVIVIDEFQYLGRSNPAFPSIIQRIWDEILKDRSVMLILCGSLISMMESQTLSYTSPLYGRRTAQLRMKQIPFRYYHRFFPEKSRKECIELYSVTGGVPKYIESMGNAADIYSAIEQFVLNRSGYLYDEPYFLLRQEVSEVGSYFSIIRVIASGNRKLSAISSALEVKATSLTNYLKTLIDLDILEREVPVTEDDPDKSKKGLYKIKDNYIRFWFSFIYPNRSLLESGNAEVVMRKIRQGLVSNQIAYVYEDICREKMWQMNTEGKWPFHFSKIGRYWDRQTEIDIAALDPEENNLILGECKYHQDPIDIDVLMDLEKKAANVPWRRENRKVWYVLFSLNGYSKTLQELPKQRGDVLLAE